MIKTAWSLIKATFSEWTQDKASMWAAAIAYFTMFAIAPLLIIVIAIAGFVFGDEAARGQIVGQLQGLIGSQGAVAVQDMIKAANKPAEGLFATVAAVVTLLLAASGLFGNLQDALNTIWEVAPKPDRGILGMIRSRFISFTMVLGIGFLLLVSLVLSAAVSAITGSFSYLLPGPGTAVVLQVANFVLSFAMTTLLFAMIYKVLPDVEIDWRDVLIGAVITALLFTVGKFLIGLYLGHSSVSSSYGAAGSLVVLLIWVYYSAQILFLGAEFTQVYATRYGKEFEPSKGAMFVGDRTARGALQKPEHAAAKSAGDGKPRLTTVATPGLAVGHGRRAIEGQVVPKRKFWLGRAIGAILAFNLGLMVAGRRRRDCTEQRVWSERS